MAVSAELVVLLTALVSFLAALVAGFVVVWREVRHVHHILNSRLDELLELTRKTAKAEGIAEGMDRPSTRE